MNGFHEPIKDRVYTFSLSTTKDWEPIYLMDAKHGIKYNKKQGTVLTLSQVSVDWV